jgi:hexosaminidase
MNGSIHPYSNRCELDKLARLTQTSHMATNHVRRTPYAVRVLIAGLLAQFAAAEPRLMPWPASVTPGKGAIAIDSSFSIAVSGYSDKRLEAAVGRILTRISRQTGTQFIVGKPTLSIECRGAAPENPTLGEDESYRLDVTPAGATLHADTVTGALRGLETFAQLITPGESGFEVPAIHIEDHPRFPWRGLMIDVARHWIPPAAIERNIDAMAAVKMNVLHWHLTDDQGFRVESVRFPRLQQSGSDGHFYTQAEIRHIVAYARDRGVRVVPEFDMPGHATSWVVGMPELASAPGPYQIERTWGIFEPTMDPTREETYAFLDAFIGEMAALFPDPFFHIGGDEVEDKQWKQSARIQDFAKDHGFKTSPELQAYFNQRVEKIVKKYGKTMVGWDEVLAPGLDSSTVIQSWRGQQSLADAARKGYRGILSFGYYLDHLKPAAFHYAVDPLDGAARELDSENASRILGGEACMWSEYVSAETIDSRIWPRAAAVAERLWSPAGVKDVESMYTRLEAVSRVLDWVGVQHRANLDRMLDLLVGGKPSEPIHVLANAVEALGIVNRRGARKYTSLVPLNRLVDAARPESEPIRALEHSIAEFGSKSPGAEEIHGTLAAWRDNHTLMQPLAAGNSLVRELLPISEDLSTLGAIGLQALKYLEAGQTPPASWMVEQRRLLGEIEKPKVEVVLAAVRPVRMLLDAAEHTSTAMKNRDVRPVTNLPVTRQQPF